MSICKKTKIKKSLSWIISFIIIGAIVCTPTLSVYAGQNNVTLSVQPMPKAEVSFAVGNTKINYANFNNDLITALGEKGISSDDVSFISVNANASSSQNAFSWWTYDHSVSGNISSNSYIETTGNQSANDYNDEYRHIVSTNNGATMDFYGYGSSGYKDFNFLPNTQATKKTIEFTIAEGTAYDALDGIGFLVNTSITGSNYASEGSDLQVINGYLLFFQYYGSGNNRGKGQSIKLFKLTDVNTYKLHHELKTSTFDTPSSIPGVELKATAETEYSAAHKYRKLKIEVMPEYIKVWYAGSSSNNAAATLTDTNIVEWPNDSTQYPLTAGYDTISGIETYRGGYGPLISYRSHNCANLTHVTLSNLKMTADYVRSLTEVVREPSWSDDKVSFLINLNEQPIEDFSDAFSTAEIINRLEDDNITYIGWCGNKNASDSQQFIEGLAEGSTLININDTEKYGSLPYSPESYNLQIENIAEAIAKKLKQEQATPGINTYLNTEEFGFLASGATLNDGNWSVGYSPESFDEASDGANISTYQNLANASFKQSGYYEIYYNGDVANPKARIRIHEEPIVRFNVSASSSGINVINKSYDPEICENPSLAQGASEDGIVTSVLEYMNLTDDNPEWKTIAPTSVKNTDAWMIRLTVTDADGAQSNLVQQVSTAINDVAPYASFRLTATQYIKGINPSVDIIDQSYALDASTDFTVTYKIRNSSNTVIWTSSNEILPGGTYQYPLASLAEGNYTVEMTAKKGDAESEKVSRTFSVVQGYTVTYSSDGGNGIPSTQYKIKNAELTISNTAPTKTGYTFAGWSDGNSGVYQPGDSYNSNANLSLSAIWLYNMTYTAEGYEGTYNGQSYGISVGVSDPLDGYTIRYGESANSCNLTQSPKYKNAGTNTVYFTIQKEGCQPITGSRTVIINPTAPNISIEDKKVSYDGAEKSIDAATVTGIAANDIPTGEVRYAYYTDSSCINLTSSANSGTSTEGGRPVNEGIYYVKATVLAAENYTAKTSNVAKLQILKYVTTFNMNGKGKQAVPQTTGIVGGSTIIEPSKPIDDNYIFIGWYKENALINPWDFDIDTVTSDTQLYAKWKEKSSYETVWEIEGIKYYGTFQDALSSGATNITIQNDITISGSAIIAPNVKLTVGPLAEVTIDGSLINNGTIINTGVISGGGQITNLATINNETGILGTTGATLEISNTNGNIIGGEFKENIKITGGNITGNIINGGTIENANLSKVTNIINNAGITYKVSGNVSYNDETLASNAKVQILRGNTVIGSSQTDLDGNFEITEVPSGVYNIIITTSTGNKKTFTLSVETSNLVEDYVIPIRGGIVTIVKVAEDIPDVVADGIDSIGETTVEEHNKGVTTGDKQVAEEGGNVDINIHINKVNLNAIEKTNEVNEIKKIVENNTLSVGLFVDISITKVVTTLSGNVTSTKLIELPEIVKLYIDIPEDLQGKQTYVLYRYHEGNVDTITMTPNEAGEYIELSEDQKQLIIHVRKFSTYAIGYSEEEVHVANASIDVTPDIVESPNTGDSFVPQMWLSIMLIMSATVILIIRKKKAVKRI